MLVVEGLHDGRADLPRPDDEDPHERVAYSCVLRRQPLATVVLCGSAFSCSSVRWSRCSPARRRRRERLQTGGRGARARRARAGHCAAKRGRGVSTSWSSAEPFASSIAGAPQRVLPRHPHATAAGGEQGLLGLAFDPEYATNRFVYVNYTDTSGDTRIVRYRTNGTRAIPSSARRLLFIDQPYSNHNGGGLAFGSDGFLYVGTGDGGSGATRRTAPRTCRACSGRCCGSTSGGRDLHRKSWGWGCATRGGTPSTGSRAISTSATWGRVRSRKSRSRLG